MTENGPYVGLCICWLMHHMLGYAGARASLTLYVGLCRCSCEAFYNVDALEKNFDKVLSLSNLSPCLFPFPSPSPPPKSEVLILSVPIPE
jgi:hypothetical protein